MAQFTNNQVKQLYVAKSLAVAELSSASADGAIFPKSNDSDLYFSYKGPDTVITSDLIPKTKITYAKATSYAKMQRALKKTKVVLDTNVNGGAPVAGQEYILRVGLFALNTPSYEDVYYKHASVKATTGMTDTALLTALKTQLALSLATEEQDLLALSVVDAVAPVEEVASKFTGTVAGLTTAITITADVAGEAGDITLTADSTSKVSELIAAHNLAAEADEKVILTDGDGTQIPTADIVLSGGVDEVVGSAAELYLEEVEQPWQLGRRQVVPLNFKVYTPEITVAGETVSWGTVTEGASDTKLGNGKNIADMEYFYMGERGDQYRMVGFPNYIETEYLVDSSLEYNVIDIEFYYSGDEEDVQRSKKYCTIVVPAVGVNNAAKITLANQIITAINAAHGTTLIADLS